MRVDLPPDRPRVVLPLHDGRSVTLLPLAPDDRPYLEAGLAELSPESRFSRFGQGVERLSDAEFAYLTDVDQRRHVAWGAVVEDEGVGVGRYIVMPDGSADVAITVLDHHQGTGVGTALFTALAAVAQHDGVPRFHLYVVPGNHKVIEMVRSLGVALADSDGLLEGRLLLQDVDIPDAPKLVAAMEEYRGS